MIDEVWYIIKQRNQTLDLRISTSFKILHIPSGFILNTGLYSVFMFHCPNLLLRGTSSFLRSSVASSCHSVCVTFASTSFILFVCTTPTVGMKKNSDTYVHKLLLSFGDFYSTLPVRLNEELESRAYMKFCSCWRFLTDIILLLNFLHHPSTRLFVQSKPHSQMTSSSSYINQTKRPNGFLTPL